MKESLSKILEIQELDMQMIQLMRVKKEQQKELENVRSIQKDLQEQLAQKKEEITEVKTEISLAEGEVEDLQEKLKTLEGRQHEIKKVEEFNALSHEMSQTEREKGAKEQKLSDLYDKSAAQEDLLKSLEESLDSATESGVAVSKEIIQGVTRLNKEGAAIKEKRDALVKDADSELFRIYERLLKNKKDKVVVSIENRCCSGCHIVLTAQHENLVRKGERLVFCEHCSRIHYWQEGAPEEGVLTKPRRRRKAATPA